ncbi:unnamed protein product, partial [Allacma fusca]
MQRTILQKILDPKSYDTHLCPGGQNTSGVLVTISAHVRSIFDLDDSKGEVSFQLTITQNWNDPRLSYASRLKNEGKLFINNKAIVIHARDFHSSLAIRLIRGLRMK